MRSRSLLYLQRMGMKNKCLQDAKKQCRMLQLVRARALHLHRVRFWSNLECRDARWQSTGCVGQNYVCCDGDYTNQRQPLIRGCLNFQRGELKKRDANMHVTKHMTSQQMMVEQIGAANGRCTLHGVCPQIGDNQEDLEGPLLNVITPRILTSTTSSHSTRYISCSTARGNPMQSVETIDGFSPKVDVWIARGNPMHEVGTQAASSVSGSKAVSASSTELVHLCASSQVTGKP